MNSFYISGVNILMLILKMINRENLQKLFTSFKNKNILVLGDVILDSYIKGDTDRISPEAPVPVVLQKSTIHSLGGASNVANNIASLGGSTTLIGIVGKDEDANIIKDLAAHAGISEKLVTDPNRPTTVKTRVTSRRNQLLRIDREMDHKVEGNVEKEIIEQIKNLPTQDLVIISDYVKGCLTENIVGALAAKFGKEKIIADIKPANVNLAQGLFAITPNLKEACEIVGVKINESIPFVENLTKSLSERFSTSVVLTKGEHGMTIYDKENKKIQNIPSKALNIYDVTGAGDTVVAVLVLMLASGHNLYDSADFANHVAGFVVGKEGTTKVDPDTLTSYLLDNHESLA